jgi:F-type H+-transporting ATPase subunit gamma
MASLKDLRNRINSVKATRKITKAMQMVAAAKLRRAQEAAEAARPYAERMSTVLNNLASAVTDPQGASPLLVGTGKSDVHLLIMMTATRGLCGGFNSNIAKLVRVHARKLLSEGKTVKIIAVGRKGSENLRRDYGRNIIETVNLGASKFVEYEHASEIADKVMAMYQAGEFDVATMFFSEFKSVIAQHPTAHQLIPARLADAGAAETPASGGAAYEYEPEEDAILDYLLKRNISTQIFRGLLENAASEQGARMSAMDSATRNATEMIDALTITYNRQRPK